MFYEHVNYTPSVCVNVSALKIHMSENARNAIKAFPEFITECRGDIAVKVEIPLLFIDKNLVFAQEPHSYSYNLHVKRHYLIVSTLIYKRRAILQWHMT